MARAIVLMAAWLCVVPAVARAQYRDLGPPISSPRVAGKLALGLLGTVDVEDEDPSTANIEDDLLVSYGFEAELSFPVHTFVTIGVLGRMLWMNLEEWDDNNIDRSMTLDLDAVLRVRYPVTSGTIAIEPYLGIPVGLSFSFLNDDVAQAWPAWANVETSSNIGWNIGIIGGAIFWVARQVGILAEIGWSHHFLSNEFSWRISTIASGQSDVDSYLDEVALDLGVAVSF